MDTHITTHYIFPFFFIKYLFGVQIDGIAHVLLVGVVEQLPYQVVLGLDLPILPELITKQSTEAKVGKAECFVAITRSKRQEQASLASVWEELPFANGEMPNVINSHKEKKSRRQRTQERVRGTKVVEGNVQPCEPDMPCIPSDVGKLQKEDPTLAPLFSKCMPESSEVIGNGKEAFIIKGDKLFRRSEIGDQLVVPQELRPTILHLSHSIPWAGHLGQAKTFSRMVPRFYWP